MFCVTCSLKESVETEMLLGKHLFLWKMNGMCVAWHLIYECTQKGDVNIFPPPPPPQLQLCLFSCFAGNSNFTQVPVLSLFTVLRTAQYAGKSQQTRSYEAVKTDLSFWWGFRAMSFCIFSAFQPICWWMLFSFLISVCTALDVVVTITCCWSIYSLGNILGH